MERVAIAVTAKVGFDHRPPPKFKVPSDPAREFINISGERTGWKWKPPPSLPPPSLFPSPFSTLSLSLSHARFAVTVGAAIAFLPLPPAFERRRSYIAPRGTPPRQPPPRLPRKGAACRCHCTALGEGHYSEQGEPVTSAPTPAIDPTPVGRGCNAPDVHCRFSR